MTANNAEGLWALVVGKYAGNCHIIRHVELPSMVRHAELENSIIEGWAVDHFGLHEALEKVRAYVERKADFPP